MRLLILLMLLVASIAHADSVSAKLSSWKFPEATRAQAFDAFVRIVINEAGFRSEADTNLIFQVVESRSGQSLSGRRWTKAMRTMVAYSNRTFPAASPFVPPGLGAQTTRQLWVSEVDAECSAPEHWPAHWTGWSAGEVSYQDRCLKLRARVRLAFLGKMENWCVSRVDHWGGAMDIKYPTQGGWVRVRCDKPDSYSLCDAARTTDPDNPEKWPGVCSKNIGWCVPSLGGCK